MACVRNVRSARPNENIGSIFGEQRRDEIEIMVERNHRGHIYISLVRAPASLFFFFHSISPPSHHRCFTYSELRVHSRGGTG